MEPFKVEALKRARPLSNNSDLAPLIEEIKDKKVVMLGESSHGTSEFYQWRKEISLELIRNHGFNFIGVEGDWPACQEVNRFVMNRDEGEPWQFLKTFSRWPTWMWANTDVNELIQELKDVNLGLEKKIGFYGLDVYSLFDSIDVVLVKLHGIDPKLARKAAELYQCFEPYRHDERQYARSLFEMPEGCEKEAARVLQEALERKLTDVNQEEIFDVIQNAQIVQNAEKYYRAMISFDDDSWNVRDQHMMSTLDMLMNHHGPNAKGIVWEHNTHIGDYRATDMVLNGNVNIGGLAREKYGEENVALVGFGTHSGTVVASTAWDGPILEMEVPEGKEGSVEDLLHKLVHEVGSSDFFLLMNDQEAKDSALGEYRGHRAIGVVYSPFHESRGNYVPTSLSKRYDAFVFIDKSKALTPYDVTFRHEKIPETYPFGARL